VCVIGLALASISVRDVDQAPPRASMLAVLYSSGSFSWRLVQCDAAPSCFAATVAWPAFDGTPGGNRMLLSGFTAVERSTRCSGTCYFLLAGVSPRVLPLARVRLLLDGICCRLAVTESSRLIHYTMSCSTCFSQRSSPNSAIMLWLLIVRAKKTALRRRSCKLAQSPGSCG